MGIGWCVCIVCVVILDDFLCTMNERSCIIVLFIGIFLLVWYGGGVWYNKLLVVWCGGLYDVWLDKVRVCSDFGFGFYGFGLWWGNRFFGTINWYYF